LRIIHSTAGISDKTSYVVFSYFQFGLVPIYLPSDVFGHERSHVLVNEPTNSMGWNEQKLCNCLLSMKNSRPCMHIEKAFDPRFVEEFFDAEISKQHLNFKKQL
jgi:hypothetical protein